MFLPGDPAPQFIARCTFGPQFPFDLLAGRYVVICLFGSAAHPDSRRMLDDIEPHASRFDGVNAVFCGVSCDPEDEKSARVRPRSPGFGFFWDFDFTISRLFGAASAGSSTYSPHTLILDRGLRTLVALSFQPGNATHAAQVLQILDRLPPVAQLPGIAPVLHIPMVFEPDFCRALVQLFEQHGGEDIGVLSEVNGQTVRVKDEGFKRRTDYQITDPSLIAAVHARFHRRLVPEIKKSFQFNATRIERNSIACYDAATGGYFQAHRDDGTKGSAHRRFAVTINLNTEQYAGGDLRFREFGFKTYRAPSGDAIVFSCSLLHEVMPVEKGKRYAFLPFLYDEDAQRIREQNQQIPASEQVDRAQKENGP